MTRDSRWTATTAQPPSLPHVRFRQRLIDDRAAHPERRLVELQLSPVDRGVEEVDDGRLDDQVGQPGATELIGFTTTEVLFAQTYPYDTATFTSATNTEQSESKVGFHAGADVAVYFSDTIGVGWLARFSRATVDFTSPDGGTVSVDAGGFQTGGGLRIRF